MNVFSYSDSADPESARISEIWRRSWAARGWDAQILGISDAKKHPRYKEVLAAAEKAPKEERAAVRTAYRRWLAFSVAGGGFLSELEVINYAFAPQGYPVDFLTVYRKDAVPCLVACTARTADQFVDHLTKLDTVCTDTIALQRHQRPAYLAINDLVKGFMMDGHWATSPLVRYDEANVCKFGFHPTSELIEYVRPLEAGL